MLSVGSVCSGAGGFDIGFRDAGYRTTWLCEFDPFRQELLAQNFPGVPVHPDLTELDPDELERPTVLIGGTPCQDLSNAGNRAGLDGERSRLFWHFMRVRNHLGVEWCVWENVAGALSSNDGLDFAQILAAMVGADVPVPSGGWPGAGVATGPWGGAVWRLLDAQHFGVPQRRRRVFVVGHLGGPCPPEVLLEPAGGDGHPPARRRTGQGTAGVAASLTRGAGRPGTAHAGRHLIAAPILRRHGKGVDSDVSDGQLITHTLRAGGFDASEDGTGRGTPLTVVGEHTQGVGEDGRPHDRRRADAGADGVPHDAGPDHRRRGAGDGEEVGRQRGAERLSGAAPDADGVRAADGLAGPLDGAAMTYTVNAAESTAKQRHAFPTDVARSLDSNGSFAAGQGGTLVAGTPAEGSRSAYDHQPDGRRYAACGDGVASPVAEWIARRLADVIEKELADAA